VFDAIISITKNAMFVNIQKMGRFKSLLLMFCIAGCVAGSSGSSNRNNDQNLTPEQQIRNGLATGTWQTGCQNDLISSLYYVVGNYQFTYSDMYNTSTNTVTYYPFTDTTCSGTPSYDIKISSDYVSLGSVDGETDTSNEITTSLGLTQKFNYRISSVTLIPHDSDGISTAAACGIGTPVLNVEYNISGCISAGVPTNRSFGYTIMYVGDSIATFTIEVALTSFDTPNDRPTDFSVQAPNFMTYTH